MRRKVVSLILAATMLTTILTGCGSKASTTATDNTNETATSSEASATPKASGELDTSEEVNLTMYVISDRPAGQDVVDENINKILKEKLNCTLTINWIPWSDYPNKYPLLFSSGEAFDMAYTGSWLNFTSLAQKGAFMNLDELWPAYAPKNFAAQSEAAQQQATVDGHYYCVPTMLATYSAYGPVYRTDLLDGTNWDGKMENFEDLEKYLDLIKEKHPEMEPLDIYSAGSELDDNYLWSLGYMSSKGANNDFLFFNPEEANPKLFTFYECKDTTPFLDMMARWNEKGFYPKSALSDTDATKTQNGKSAVRVHNLDTFAGYSTTHREFAYSYANFVKHVRHFPYTQDAMVISNTSQNPERALAVWDLITSDREMFDAFMYGVEGTTYTLNEEGQYLITDPDQYAGSAMWSARTNELNRDAVGTPELFGEMKQEFEKAIAADDTAEKYASFVIDTSNIETEYAACQSVHQQYWWPLELGYTDAKTGLAEYQKQMEAAGLEKVRTELQGQLDAYVAALQ
ncbi:MAG: extracellular solute-binding protein [Lachnospiraceae bacterium]|nr:extracellular solute-binding protein [Lachnospiraceae bacterium]